jgi:hypothetical protein
MYFIIMKLLGLKVGFVWMFALLKSEKRTNAIRKKLLQGISI